jgi:cyclophilin family peptidyl-prolyl cis-trans isomerase
MLKRIARPSPLQLEHLERREMLHGSDIFPIVTLETNMGDISIELFEEDAPQTVANFLNYVDDGDYTNSIFHRLVRGFVLQGGGFTNSSETICQVTCDATSLQPGDVNPAQFAAVPTDPPVVNEFGRSNTRGTVAMAKLGNDPNSATSQFFVNLNDNSANLDNQNGGFTVFGQVVDMSVVDAIAQLGTVNLASFFPAGDPRRAIIASPYISDASGPLGVRVERVSGKGLLHGKVYLDNDGDGQLDIKEGGMAGRTVFLDLNANGSADTSEPRSETDESGEYHFLVDPGQYSVSILEVPEFLRTGILQRVVDAEIGRSAEDLNFGLKYNGTSWHNPLTATDVDGINGTTPIDPLLIINELTNRTVSDRVTGRLPLLEAPPTVPIFFDVHQNGEVAPLDALLAIAGLPRTQEPAPPSGGSASDDQRPPLASEPLADGLSATAPGSNVRPAGDSTVAAPSNAAAPADLAPKVQPIRISPSHRLARDSNGGTDDREATRTLDLVFAGLSAESP